MSAELTSGFGSDRFEILDVSRSNDFELARLCRDWVPGREVLLNSPGSALAAIVTSDGRTDAAAACGGTLVSSRVSITRVSSVR